MTEPRARQRVNGEGANDGPRPFSEPHYLSWLRDLPTCLLCGGGNHEEPCR